MPSKENTEKSERFLSDFKNGYLNPNIYYVSPQKEPLYPAGEVYREKFAHHRHDLVKNHIDLVEQKANFYR